MAFSSVFLLVISVLVINSADAAGRCKTSQDCTEPKYLQFCDDNFYACWPCSHYCSKEDDENKRHCFAKCPLKYEELYERAGRDKPNRKLPNPDEREPNVDAVGVAVGVGITGIVLVLIVVAVVVVRKRQAKPDFVRDVGYCKVFGNDQVTIGLENNEDDKKNKDNHDAHDGNGRHTENRNATKIGQNPDPSPTGQLCFNNSHPLNMEENGNTQPLPLPRPNFDVDSVRSFSP